MIDGASALSALTALGDAQSAAEAAATHKVGRAYLGVRVAAITELAKGWREGGSVEERVALAAELWDSDIHEARVAAARLLTQARIRPDAPVWEEICRWVPQLDCQALSDVVADAGARRLVADPARLDTVQDWALSPGLWVRRAVFTFTLPWAKLTHPTEAERAARERVLGWAEAAVPVDRNGIIQGALSVWLRTLSKHDPARVRAFMAGPGAELKRFARNEALRYLD
ncbi:DNA alkylation repair protein [Paroceanicella profunda]|uniref:DNA alkylation repair protein n=1 Tax=Paroceanicella profunda TaxID=2579971 RepID=A0A5B8FV23_9RHOB|nr:DNA alkylation repair protein [Paroceanicella profunda]QDL92235.1 DNA alkylation repair protein [Paroceanicella profunda]